MSTPPTQRARHHDLTPLSFPQQALWFLHRFENGSSAYHLPLAFRLQGPLDLDALRHALQSVVDRQESLRTRFVEIDGIPGQIVEPRVALELPVHDFTRLDPGSVEAAMEAFLAREFARPFDLGTAPLLRVALLRLGPEDHVLCSTTHHIISDGWSMAVWHHDLSAFYAARVRPDSNPHPLPPLAARYADFAIRQHAHLAGDALRKSLDFWRDHVARAPMLEFPTDRPRPPRLSFDGACREFRVPAETAARLTRLCRAEMATPYMAFLALYEALLARLSGQTEFLLGTPAANRWNPDFESLVGFFANMLALRADLSGDPSFRDLLQRSRAKVFASLEHQELPLEKLVETLNPPRDPSRQPLFQIIFALQNAPDAGLDLPGLTVRVVPWNREATRFDLELHLRPSGTTWLGRFIYSTALFDAPTIDRLARRFLTLLDAVLAEPDRSVLRAELLPPDERERILADGTGPRNEVPADRGVHQLLEQQAALRPDAVALATDDTTTTYGELNRRANQLARLLQSHGVGPDSLVPLAAERSVETIVALLAILKAGGAYVPLDPHLPAHRLALLLHDLQAPLLLAQHAFRDAIPAPAPADPRETAAPAPHLLVLEEAIRASATLPNTDLPFLGNGGSPAYVMHTSGTTGIPKGAIIPHRGITRLVVQPDYVKLDADEVLLQFAPLSFDASTFEIWGALANGARLVLGPVGPPDLADLGRHLRRHRVTTLWLTAALFRQVVDQTPEALDGVRQVLSGGDVLPPDTVARFFQRPGHGRLVNGYGPTENTTFTTCHAMDAAPPPNRSVPIGRPIRGTIVRILDDRGQLAPIGTPGHLHTGGDGLALGYLRRPGLTAERFVPDPFAAGTGARLYRTGDRARLLPDGTFEFLGRFDHQIKVRGFRVEPEEVEVVLASHPALAQAAVIAPRGPDGIPQLRAFFVLAPAASMPTAADLRAHLAARVPDYLIPVSFTPVPALPVSPNGKLDRPALAAVDTPCLPAGSGYVAPRSELERGIAATWEQLLGRGRIGVHESFFEIGGHSLLAIQVASRLRAQLGREIPVRTLFVAPTIETLARALETEPPVATTPASTSSPHRSNEGISPRDPQRYRITDPSHPHAGAEAVPASPAQTRMWLMGQLEPGDSAYQISDVLRLRGRLDLDALAMAIGDLAERHEAFRTSFVSTGGTIQQVIHPWRPLAPRLVDLSEGPAADAGATLARELELETGRGFDPASAPLARFTIFRLGPEEHVLAIVLDHLVSDAWSFGILRRELPALYAARRRQPHPPLAPLPIQYADFAVWNAERPLDTDALESLRRELADAPEHSSLAPDLLPAERPTARGRQIRTRLAGPDWAAFSAFCHEEELTPFMALLAFLALLLGRLGAREDVVLGAPVATRGRVELESVVGVLLNVLPLRCRWSPDLTLRDYLRGIRELALGAFARQDLPFERVIEALAPSRAAGRTPLVQVLLNVLPPRDRETPAWPGLAVDEVPLEIERSKFDLTLYAQPGPDGLDLALSYRTDLYSAARIEVFLDQLLHLLRQAPAARLLPLDTLSLVTPGARERLPDPRQPIPAPEPPGITETLAALVAGDGGEFPALDTPHGRLSRAELHDAAERVARHLASLLAPEQRTVAIGGPRSAGVIVALLATLRAEAIALPLDPLLPEARLLVLLGEARPAVALWSGSPEQVPAAVRAGVPRLVFLDPATGQLAEAADAPWPELPSGQPSGPAYLFFTSGTTGVPKAVLGSRRGLAHFLHWQRTTFAIGPGDRAAHLTGLGFDVVLRDLLTPLTGGATLCLPAPDLDDLPENLLAWLARARVTVLHAVPSLARVWLDAAPEDLRLPDLRLVFFAGEPLPDTLVRRWRSVAPACRIINLYGPTETTLAKCFHEVVGDPLPGIQPLGRPLPDTQVLILSPSGRPCGLGEPGEIAIRTPFRSLGYLNAPERTAERFVRHAGSDDPEDLLYRTGDLGRFRTDGTIDFLGRADSQVKIRGIRIELDEIVVALARHPGVSACSVHAREESDRGRFLVACVVASPTATPPPGPRELTQFLRLRLPAAYVPARFLFLDRLPLTPNGKVDVAALARHPLTAESTPSALPSISTASADSLQTGIAHIWSSVLPGRTFTPESDFFEQGGDSLLALRVLSRLRARLGLSVTLADFFRQPTIAGLAAVARPIAAVAATATVATATAPAAVATPEPTASAAPRRLLGAAAGTPLFVVPGYFGLGGLRPGFVDALRAVVPYYDRLRYAGVDDTLPAATSMAAISDHLIGQIEELHPPSAGPLCLAGFSFGGTMAFEVARRLRSRGRDVPLLILYDSRLTKAFRPRTLLGYWREILRRARRQPRGRKLAFLFELGRARLAGARSSARPNAQPEPGAAPTLPLPADVPPEVGQSGLLKEAVRRGAIQAYAEYQPGPYPGRVVLFRSTEVVPNEWLRLEVPPCNGWRPYVTGPFEIVPVARDHLGLMADPPDPVALERTLALLREVQTLR